MMDIAFVAVKIESYSHSGDAPFVINYQAISDFYTPGRIPSSEYLDNLVVHAFANGENNEQSPYVNYLINHLDEENIFSNTTEATLLSDANGNPAASLMTRNTEPEKKNSMKVPWSAAAAVAAVLVAAAAYNAKRRGLQESDHVVLKKQNEDGMWIDCGTTDTMSATTSLDYRSQMQSDGVSEISSEDPMERITEDEELREIPLDDIADFRPGDDEKQELRNIPLDDGKNDTLVSQDTDETSNLNVFG